MIFLQNILLKHYSVIEDVKIKRSRVNITAPIFGLKIPLSFWCWYHLKKHSLHRDCSFCDFPRPKDSIKQSYMLDCEISNIFVIYSSYSRIIGPAMATSVFCRKIPFFFYHSNITSTIRSVKIKRQLKISTTF